MKFGCLISSYFFSRQYISFRSLLLLLLLTMTCRTTNLVGVIYITLEYFFSLLQSNFFHRWISIQKLYIIFYLQPKSFRNFCSSPPPPRRSASPPWRGRVSPRPYCARGDLLLPLPPPFPPPPPWLSSPPPQPGPTGLLHRPPGGAPAAGLAAPAPATSAGPACLP